MASSTPTPTRPLHTDEITWAFSGGAPWPDSWPALRVALDALPLIEDDVAIAIIEQLAGTIADQRDQLRALRSVLSAALALTHRQETQLLGQRRRLDALRPRPV